MWRPTGSRAGRSPPASLRSRRECRGLAAALLFTLLGLVIIRWKFPPKQRELELALEERYARQNEATDAGARAIAATPAAAET